MAEAGTKTTQDILGGPVYDRVSYSVVPSGDIPANPRVDGEHDNRHLPGDWFRRGGRDGVEGDVPEDHSLDHDGMMGRGSGQKYYPPIVR